MERWKAFAIPQDWNRMVTEKVAGDASVTRLRALMRTAKVRALMRTAKVPADLMRDHRPQIPTRIGKQVSSQLHVGFVALVVPAMETSQM
jgi:hypothetical protein